MKKCVIVSDSFKGTLSSMDICEIAKGVFDSFMPECELITVPVADGGEGTVDCFVSLGAERITTKVRGPWGEKIEVDYARSGNRAIIEMSAAAGLPLVVNNKNPALTSTFGVGEQILHAVNNGCKELLLGLGGSATNDGGCGCAAALGVKFIHSDGHEFVPVGATLDEITEIDVSKAKKLLEHVNITLMCDVSNPLYGKQGAAYIFAPQKGADASMVVELDSKLERFGKLLSSLCETDVCTMAGGGAAGGMGAGCVALLNAHLSSGIDAVLDAVNFEQIVQNADLVISGEGKLDSQSLGGKVISGVAARCAAERIPLVVLAGCVDDSAEKAYESGVAAVFNTNRACRVWADVADHAREDYKLALSDILRLILIAEKFR